MFFLNGILEHDHTGIQTVICFGNALLQNRFIIFNTGQLQYIINDGQHLFAANLDIFNIFI